MVTKNDITEKIHSDFKTMTGKEFRHGSAINFYTEAIGRSLETAFQEIEDNKNPHIYTNLDTDGLNKTGTFVGVPRNDGEDDQTYLYRIMNWTNTKAASNLSAVNAALLGLTNASNAQYFPGIYGAGTGVIYVIPNDYTQEVITAALAEAKDKVKSVISPESYTEYIVPKILPVKLLIKMTSDKGDMTYLKAAIEISIKKYINAIAPMDYLSIGKINKIGTDTDNVDYFNTLMLYVSSVSTTDTKIMQQLETKFIFDEIIWQED